MLFRFSLYGFLKNQRYYEPFLVLAFLEKGLNFQLIGLLIAFREMSINLMEIPSGGFADVYGRRSAMILSFSAYLVSFTVFGFANHFSWLMCGMFFFAIGEAFRSGTHKAMIFTWLRLQGRENERTRVYGYTRSWSKLGSALSVVLGAAFVFGFESYSQVFFYSAVPCLFSMINLMGYPPELEGETKRSHKFRDVVAHTRATIGFVWSNRSLRLLLGESMGFEGYFVVVKDYLQPILKAGAVLLATLLAGNMIWSETRFTAILIGIVFFVLHLGSAAASRNAHRLVAHKGGADQAAKTVWVLTVTLFTIIFIAGWFGRVESLAVAFVLLYILQNIWRPIQVSRIDAHLDDSHGATVMSLESQAKRVAMIILAPLLGWAVDVVSLREPSFWPLGLIGLMIGLVFWRHHVARGCDPMD